MAGTRCVDVDFGWISGQQHAEAEFTIGRVLTAAGWTYAGSHGPSQRYCRADDFDKALAEAQQTVGEWLALRWEESGGQRMRPAEARTEAQREAYRIVGSWVVTLVDPADVLAVVR